MVSCLKPGIDVSQASVAKYMMRREKPPSQTWRTFLKNHLHQIAAADFFVVPTATCRLLFVLVILAHERRRIVHVAVTDHPTAAWTAQQLREAFPWNEAPRYLFRDRDSAFYAWTTTAAAIGIEEILTAPRSPWQRLCRATHRLHSARVPRSHHHRQCARIAPRLDRVRRVLPEIAYASLAQQGLARFPASRAADRRQDRGDPLPWWLAPPIRTSRCLVQDPSGRSSRVRSRWHARPNLSRHNGALSRRVFN
jgi:hypothetical protein